MTLFISIDLRLSLFVYYEEVSSIHHSIFSRFSHHILVGAARFGRIHESLGIFSISIVVTGVDYRVLDLGFRVWAVQFKMWGKV